ncbi:pentatricopeptide repeat-containing protein At5g27110-like [Selaginella moellendorffii]|uniref:pentatricopeptide repeat-containing protein At5g27110-like n=1 Tax=Selaginella moellendorffii TaxID=88036 RepID=UPI000D1C2857|nr:pentatricopeptide repeat-containing protein At5g27110-like [Selaginella moellendorffii]XP_024517152.1 pentatricopeptide repeat-containing protein At5g27110-like [Selaginella moellendorffii]|eukprot:XP_024517151.1 pentatricopeptide repeat-containing protein At5g27110-like [Selaginella moellendorffii]
MKPSREAASLLPGTHILSSDPQVSSVIFELKSAARSKELERGKEIHARATESGKNTNIYVANSLIGMYGKCGSMAEARRVFDKITAPTVVSWNSLILGYADNGEAFQALELFARIANLSTISPDRATFLAALKACSKLAAIEKTDFLDCGSSKFVKIKSLEMAMAVHSRCEQARWHTDMRVASALIDAYGKSRCMASARMIFERMETHDVVSWTSMIMGYADDEDGLSGLELFQEFMASSTDRSSGRSFVAALKSCSGLAAREERQKKFSGKLAAIKMVSLERAMFLHREAAKRGFDLDMFVASTLVDLYAKCGSVDLARAVFDRLDHRFKTTNPVAWNALMLGYVDLGQAAMALDLFSQMMLLDRSKKEIFGDARTIVAAANACTSMAASEQSSRIPESIDSDGGRRRRVCVIKVESLNTGMAIHSRARGLGVELDGFVASALINMYSKCGSTIDAHRIFAMLGDEELDDPAPWNALILGYLENGQAQESLALLAAMRSSPRSMVMDARSYATAIRAHGSVMDLEGIRKLHAEIDRASRESGRDLIDPVVASCLVDAYGRCGSMDEAERFFVSSSSSRDLISWSALVAGYSRQGDAERAIYHFQRMRDEGFDAHDRAAALLCVLSACAHTGRVEQGKKFLAEILGSSLSMAGIGIEHYHCAIDMLGRADRLEEAVALVERVRSMGSSRSAMRPNAVTWSSVIDASRRSGRVGVARTAFEELVKFQEEEQCECSSAYALMAAVYHD